MKDNFLSQIKRPLSYLQNILVHGENSRFLGPIRQRSSSGLFRIEIYKRENSQFFSESNEPKFNWTQFSFLEQPFSGFFLNDVWEENWLMKTSIDRSYLFIHNQKTDNCCLFTPSFLLQINFERIVFTDL